jgi:hypothetical protein
MPNHVTPLPRAGQIGDVRALIAAAAWLQDGCNTLSTLALRLLKFFCSIPIATIGTS